jgi:hypothetical protein
MQHLLGSLGAAEDFQAGPLDLGSVHVPIHDKTDVLAKNRLRRKTRAVSSGQDCKRWPMLSGL